MALNSLDPKRPASPHQPRQGLAHAERGGQEAAGPRGGLSDLPAALPVKVAVDRT